MTNEFELIKGLTFKKVETRWSGNDHSEGHDDVLEFISIKGDKIGFEHNQDCCEGVWIEEIHGELSDLIGDPILLAEEVSFSPTKSEDLYNIRPDKSEWGELGDEYSESASWTFYKFATIKGSVTVRWLGQSNSYYSEGVNVYYEPYFLENLSDYVKSIYYSNIIDVTQWFYKNDIGSPMNEKEETLFKLRFL